MMKSDEYDCVVNPQCISVFITVITLCTMLQMFITAILLFLSDVGAAFDGDNVLMMRTMSSTVCLPVLVGPSSRMTTARTSAIQLTPDAVRSSNLIMVHAPFHVSI
jgi:hypothetical protein